PPALLTYGKRRLWLGVALEGREGGALRVGDHREAPGADIGGRPEPAPAGPLGAARGVAGVLGREMRKPGRRDAPLPPGLGADAPVAAAGVDDRGTAAAAGLVLPAEQLTEELLGPLGVGGGQLVPAQGANIVDEHGAD